MGIGEPVRLTLWVRAPGWWGNSEVDDEVVEAGIKVGGGESDIEGFAGGDCFGSGDLVEGTGWGGEESCDD